MSGIFYYYFSSSAVSSFAILRPCFLTVAFNFLISSSSSSIFNPSGSATAAATGAEFGTLLPFEICEARILNEFIFRNLNKRLELELIIFLLLFFPYLILMISILKVLKLGPKINSQNFPFFLVLRLTS